MTTRLPADLLAVALLQDGLLSAQQLNRNDVDLAHLLRRRQVISLIRDVYDVDATLPSRYRRTAGDSDQRQRRRVAWAGMLAMGPDAIAVSTNALALLGVQGLPQDIAPAVALPGGKYARAPQGLHIRYFNSGCRTVPYVGRRIAAPELALAQAVCELDRNHAVAVLDSALQQGLADLDQIRRLTAGRRGARKVRRWWALVDGRAQTPLETEARLLCVDAAVPPDDLQIPIRDRYGNLVGHADLGWRLPNGRWLLVDVGQGKHPRRTTLGVPRSGGHSVYGNKADRLRVIPDDLRDGNFIATVTNFIQRAR